LQEVTGLTKDLSTQPSETLTSSDSLASIQPTHSWKVGEKCLTIWKTEENDEENSTAASPLLAAAMLEVMPLLKLKSTEEGRQRKRVAKHKPKKKKAKTKRSLAGMRKERPR
ncbi:Survival of motor neuron-related-splicing factor 30, partial [Galemys pyrenaicus]